MRTAVAHLPRHAERPSLCMTKGRARQALAATLEQLSCILASASAEDLQASLPQFCVDILGAHAASVYALRADLVAECAACCGPLACKMSFDVEGCFALRTMRPFAGASTVPCRHANGPTVCLPLAGYGKVFGLLIIQGEFSPDEIRLAVMIAQHASLALAMLGRCETAKADSTIDYLTGLFNRRFLDASLERELRRAARERNQLAFLMLDLDFFKQVNDGPGGHIAGDELLRALGKLLRSHVRGQDLAARFGGEEFSLLLTNTTTAPAMERAELIRRAVELLPQVPGYRAVSVSIGVALYPDHASTALELLSNADVALKLAKAKGKNRVELFHPAAGR